MPKIKTAWTDGRPHRAPYLVRHDNLQWQVVYIDYRGTEHVMDSGQPLRTRKECAGFVRDLFESGDINCYACIKLLHSLVE